jgi:hypothetical protein
VSEKVNRLEQLAPGQPPRRGKNRSDQSVLNKRWKKRQPLRPATNIMPARNAHATGPAHSELIEADDLFRSRGGLPGEPSERAMLRYLSSVRLLMRSAKDIRYRSADPAWEHPTHRSATPRRRSPTPFRTWPLHGRVARSRRHTIEAEVRGHGRGLELSSTALRRENSGATSPSTISHAGWPDVGRDCSSTIS